MVSARQLAYGVWMIGHKLQIFDHTSRLWVLLAQYLMAAGHRLEDQRRGLRYLPIYISPISARRVARLRAANRE